MRALFFIVKFFQRDALRFSSSVLFCGGCNLRILPDGGANKTEERNFCRNRFFEKGGGMGLSLIAVCIFAGFLSPRAFSGSSFSKRADQALKKRGFKPSRLGLIVSEIPPDGKVRELYALNADRLFIPASLVKIPVLSALYHYYPPHKQFQTRLFSTAPVEQGVLKGDLVLKGGGDPAFTSESLWNLINVFTRTGIREVAGDILVDDTLYTAEDFSAFRTDRSYGAPAGPASFNWNSVTFRLRPGDGPGAKARIFTDPENGYIQIKNHVRTSKKGKTRISARRLSQTGKGEVFQFKGVISLAGGEVSKYRNIQDPALYFGYNLVSFLRQRGILVKGAVQRGGCSADCRRLALWESRPFFQSGYSMMKYSNNFIIRMLTTHLSLELGAEKGNFKKGMALIGKYLTGPAGLKNYSLNEPSGLSRGNKFTPRDLQKVLLLDSRRPLAPEILASYPLAGGIGTLEKRYPGRPEDYYIRAKTGSLSGVAGLAGWADRPDRSGGGERSSRFERSGRTERSGQVERKGGGRSGRFERSGRTEQAGGGGRYVFVFIYNGPARKAPKAQIFFDDLILMLLDGS